MDWIQSDGGRDVLFYYAIAAALVIMDQWTKWLVVKHMEVGERVAVWDPYLAILSHRNSGAAWGMLQGQMWLFYIVTIVVVAGILYYFHKHGQEGGVGFRVSLMMLLGGALGNFIDRLRMGEVVDFVDVLIPVINYDFPIFNVADAALTIGVVLLIVQMLLEELREKRKKKVS